MFELSYEVRWIDDQSGRVPVAAEVELAIDSPETSEAIVPMMRRNAADEPVALQVDDKVLGVHFEKHLETVSIGPARSDDVDGAFPGGEVIAGGATVEKIGQVELSSPE